LKTIIIVSPQGQLANRIIHFSHFIGVSLEYNIRIIHFCFDDYYFLFKTNFIEYNNKNIRVILLRSKFLSYCRKALVHSLRFLSRFVNGNFFLFKYLYLSESHWLSDGYFQINSDFFLNEKCRYICFDGWEFRNDLLFRKHLNTIRKLFSPDENVKNSINAELSELRLIFDFIIGVHIRRTDYIKFLDGKYYFSDDIYIENMLLITKSQKYFDKKLVFVLCSDEFIDINNFTDFRVVYKRRDAIYDLYLLSSCDAIIGPPSTFSSWASMYGQVPLHRIIHD